VQARRPASTASSFVSSNASFSVTHPR
jgi:hypothetical protein